MLWNICTFICISILRSTGRSHNEQTRVPIMLIAHIYFSVVYTVNHYLVLCSKTMKICVATHINYQSDNCYFTENEETMLLKQRKAIDRELS